MSEQNTSEEYEFSASQNQVFSGLATAMKFVGISTCILGALSLFPVFVTPLAILTNGPQAAIFIAFGLWTSRASNSVRAIVDTQGNDIQHLMNAMNDLSKLYKLQRALLILGLVVIGLAVAVLIATGGAFLSQISQMAN